MNDAVEQNEKALRSQLRQARERVDGLVRNLNAIDSELEDLSGEREQYGLLQEVCGGLEKLSALGGAGLFWDGGSDGEAHLRLVRGRVDEFEQRIRDIEGGRQAVIDDILRAEEKSDYFAGGVLEIEREKEERKRDWILEREMSPAPDRELVMPWSRGGEEDALFRKSLAAALLLSLLMGLIFPLIDLPIPERWEVAEVPE